MDRFCDIFWALISQWIVCVTSFEHQLTPFVCGFLFVWFHNITQTQQQRPKPPTGTLTWHASKHKVHKFHLRYIFISLFLSLVFSYFVFVFWVGGGGGGVFSFLAPSIFLKIFFKYLCESFSLVFSRLVFGKKKISFFLPPPTILVFTVAEKGNPDLPQRAPLQQTFRPAAPPPQPYLVLHPPLPLHLLLGCPPPWLHPLPRPQHLGPLLPHPLPLQDPQGLVPPLVPPPAAVAGAHCWAVYVRAPAWKKP